MGESSRISLMKLLVVVGRNFLETLEPQSSSKFPKFVQVQCTVQVVPSARLWCPLKRSPRSGQLVVGVELNLRKSHTILTREIKLGERIFSFRENLAHRSGFRLKQPGLAALKQQQQRRQLQSFSGSRSVRLPTTTRVQK